MMILKNFLFVFVAFLASHHRHVLADNSMQELLQNDYPAFVEQVQEGWDFDLLDLIYSDSLSDILDAEEGNVSDVRYLIWTRENPDEYFEVYFDEADTITQSNIDYQLNTYVIVHGYTNHGLADYVLEMKDAFLKKEECNVISIDYGELAHGPNYPQAVENSYKVALQAAEFLDLLKISYGMDFDKVHLVGHSLGGQLVGMIGHFVSEGELARVTGLDPAGPLYYNQTEELSISQGSGKFVDILHTNGCFLLDGCFGILNEVGHLDFYPNGGMHQPACTNETSSDIKDAIENCSHHRSVLYWIESILAESPQDNTFYSWPCEDYQTFDQGGCTSCQDGCQEMGLPSNPNHPGSFYLHTAEHAPFALGKAPSVLSSGILLFFAATLNVLVNC